MGHPTPIIFAQVSAGSPLPRLCYDDRDLPSLHSIWQPVANSLYRLSTADLRYVLAALSLYIVSLFIVGERWRGFLRALGGSVGVTRATLATLGGIAAGNLTPGRVGGEASRIALVRLRGTVTWRQATVAAIWDRLSELPPVLVLSLMALIAVRRAIAGWRAAWIVAGVVIGVIAGALAIGRLRASGISFEKWRERLALDRVRWQVFAAGVGYSSLLWFQDVLRLTCATRALGVSLSPTRIATLSMLAMLGGLVPSLAGLGPVEGGLLAGLMAFGIDLQTAAAITAIERAISYGFSTGAGALVIALMGGRSLWGVVRGRQPHVDLRDPEACRPPSD
jgi:uncharacterized membrane protein YbhN (UPF0104 family)